MTPRWSWVRALPRPLRWGALGVAGVLLAVLVGVGAWSWRERREAAARDALGPLVEVAQRAAATGEPAGLEEAARELTRFLQDHGGSRAATTAWYLLGNAQLRRGRWDEAAQAFSEAAGRDAGSVARLSRLGQGYALEGKGEMARAAEVYQQALAGLTPRDFLYGELLLAKARAHEQAKDSAAAIESYRQYLKELPTAEAAGEVRLRLGLLGVPG